MNNTINLNLTIEDVNIIMASLAKQPYEVVFGLMEKVRTQAQQQLPKQEPTTEIISK